MSWKTTVSFIPGTGKYQHSTYVMQVRLTWL